MKKLIAFTFAAIILFGGCAKTNTAPDNYAEILRAAVYAGQAGPGDSEPEPAPAPQVVSGTMTFTQPAPVTAPPETAAPETEPEPEPVYAPEPETEAPYEPYVITPSGKKYHYPTCRSAKNVFRYISKEEAESLKYTPCGICKPE